MAVKYTYDIQMPSCLSTNGRLVEGLTLGEISGTRIEITENYTENRRSIPKDTANVKHLEKSLSDRYLIMPKSTEDIMGVLGAEERSIQNTMSISFESICNVLAFLFL